MREIRNIVRDATTITDGQRQHAAYQAMDVYLADWREAHERLGRQIAVLEKLRDERKAEKEAGTWG